MHADISPFYKIFHFIPILPVYIVISTVSISVWKYFILNPEYTFFPKILFGVIFYIFAIMVIVTHTLSMITPPGYVKYGYKNKESKKGTSDDPNISQGHLFCKKCRNERPPRAHHCKKCKKCVLKMDHHCPWIANCVGYRNQKLFYQFLFFATFGDLLGFIILVSNFFDGNLLKIANNNNPHTNVWDIINEMWTPIMLAVSSLLAISMTLSIGLLFFVQTKMILYNTTSVETHIFSDYTSNPWYYEGKLHNFKIVMGETVSEWFIPRFTPNKYNNGYSFYTPKNINFSEINSNSNTTPPNYMNLEADLEMQDASHNIDNTETPGSTSR